jgi:hypothetical protein
MEEKRTYTAFWPFFIFLTGVIVANVYQVIQMYDQRIALIKQIDNTATSLKNFEQVNAKLYSLASDLVQVSDTDPNAANIVKQFNISIQEHKNDQK